jgi:3-phenylpropionate/cinnamic acid dioxygenase small subunit
LNVGAPNSDRDNVDIRIKLGVEDLIAAYSAAIDEDRLEDWPEFFVETAKYVISTKDDFDQGLPFGVIYADSRAMLIDRVTALRQANIYEPHSYRHVVGQIRVFNGANGYVDARSSFIIVRIMKDGATTLFATGEYRDRIDTKSDPFRFVERLVLTDSHKFDTLLALPL